MLGALKTIKSEEGIVYIYDFLSHHSVTALELNPLGTLPPKSPQQPLSVDRVLRAVVSSQVPRDVRKQISIYLKLWW